MKKRPIKLTKPEKQIVQDVFQNTIKAISNASVKLYSGTDPLIIRSREFSRNRIIIKLSEMLENEIETNY